MRDNDSKVTIDYCKHNKIHLFIWLLWNYHLHGYKIKKKKVYKLVKYKSIWKIPMWYVANMDAGTTLKYLCFLNVHTPQDMDCWLLSSLYLVYFFSGKRFKWNCFQSNGKSYQQNRDDCGVDQGCLAFVISWAGHITFVVGTWFYSDEDFSSYVHLFLG